MLVRVLALAALHASTALAPPDATAVVQQHGARSLQDETPSEQIPADGLKLGGCHLALQVHVNPKGYEGHHDYEMHVTVVSPWEEGTIIRFDLSASGGITDGRGVAALADGDAPREARPPSAVAAISCDIFKGILPCLQWRADIGHRSAYSRTHDVL